MPVQGALRSRACDATGRLAALLAAVLLALAAPAQAAAAPGDAPIVTASLGGGFIEFLLGGRAAEPNGPAQPAAPRQQPRPQPRHAAPSSPEPTPAPAVEAARPADWGLSYCVRTCDGYAFPLGTMRGPGDAAAHARSCAAACPGAATELFVGSRQGGFARARAVAGGAPYSAHPQAFRHRRERVEDCTCAVSKSPAARWASGDATLRRGDVLVTPAGALVFDGGRFVDFQDDRATSPALRRRIDATLGVSAREARLAAWRRAHPQAAAAAPRDVLATGVAIRAPIPPPRRAAFDARDLAAFAGWELRPGPAAH